MLSIAVARTWGTGQEVSRPRKRERLATAPGSLRRPVSKSTHPVWRKTVLDQAPISLARYCELRVERRLDTATIWLSGEFDLACEERFMEELGSVLDSLVGTLVLDLRGLQFMDSTGLRILIQIDATAQNDGFDFVVFCGNGAVRRVLHETGLDGVLSVVDPSGVVPASDSPV
jgi:anti-sigma B factor antagonist